MLSLQEIYQEWHALNKLSSIYGFLDELFYYADGSGGGYDDSGSNGVLQCLVEILSLREICHEWHGIEQALFYL